MPDGLVITPDIKIAESPRLAQEMASISALHTARPSNTASRSQGPHSEQHCKHTLFQDLHSKLQSSRKASKSTLKTA